jgi:hypothetical protein
MLRRMPPLSHWPSRPDKFLISHSETVRFILHLRKGRVDCRADWSAAVRLFQVAKVSGVLVHDFQTRKWRGCDYKPRSESPKVRRLLHETFRKKQSRGSSSAH